MKLLFCPRCWDVFKVTSDRVRKCSCGAVGGRLLEGGQHAVYYGDARPLTMSTEWALNPETSQDPPLALASVGVTRVTSRSEALDARLARPGVSDDLDLTEKERIVFMAYSEPGRHTQHEVASSTGLSQASVSRVVQALVAKGLLRLAKEPGKHTTYYPA